MKKKLLISISMIVLTIYSLTTNSQTLGWQFANKISNSYYWNTSSISADQTGNTYLTNVFGSSVTVTNQTFNNSSGYDLAVTKYNKFGEQQWYKQYGGTGTDSIYNCIIKNDLSGNVYMLGRFYGTINFDGTVLSTATNERGIYFVKLNNSGVLQFAKKIGYYNSYSFTDIDVNDFVLDNSNNVFVTGTYRINLTLGTNTLTLFCASSNNMFIGKYDSNGNFIWAQKAGSASACYNVVGSSVGVDASGNCYITGNYNNTITFNTLNITSINAQSDIYIAKYNSSGTIQWVKSAGGTSPESSNSIAVDASGNCYITGIFNYFSGNVTFGTINITGALYSNNIFIAKCNNAGTFQWVQQASVKQNVYNNNSISLKLDKYGTNFYLAGYFADTTYFGSYRITTTGSQDIFLAKYNSSGTAQWAQKAGGLSDEYINNLAIDTLGNSYITGYTNSSSVNFGNYNLNSSGYFAKYGNLLAYASTDQILCSNSTKLQGNNPSPATGTWSCISGSATILNSTLYNTTVSNIAQGTNKFRWQIGSTADTVVINNQSVLAVAGTSQTVVMDTARLSATNYNTLYQKWSIVRGNGTFANNSQSNTKVSSLAQGLNTFRWTLNNGNCNSSDTVNITYTPPAINATISMYNSYTMVGNTFEVAINTTNLYANQNVISYQFKLAYASTNLLYVSYNLNGTICSGGTVDINTSTNGLLQISLMNANPIVGSGSIIKLQFKCISKQSSSLNISNFLFNTTSSANSISSIYPYCPSAPYLGNDTSICNGNNIILNTYSHLQYLWNTGETTQSITVKTTNKYWIRTTDYDCIQSDTINIVVKPNPTPYLGKDTAICAGNSIVLNAGVYDSYLWSTTQTTATITVSTQGTYNLSVWKNGCIGKDTIKITVNPKPTPNLGQDQTICKSTNLILDAGVGDKYLWSNSTTNRTLQITTSGSYWVKVTSNNCTGSDTVNININRYGDVDGNNLVQAYDAALVLQYSVGMNPLPLLDPLPWSGWRRCSADVDGNDTLTANDASLILRYSTGNISTFPVGSKSKGNPTADVYVQIENNAFKFYSKGELYGLNIFVDFNNSNISLQPPVILDNEMLNVYNNVNGYAVGVCTAHAPAENICFMQVPYTGNQPENVIFNLIVNTDYKSVGGIITQIQSVNATPQIMIYPNPANTILNIDNVNSNAFISIYDLLGKLISHKQIDKKQIDIVNLQNGIYTIRIETGKDIITKKFIKQ